MLFFFRMCIAPVTLHNKKTILLEGLKPKAKGRGRGRGNAQEIIKQGPVFFFAFVSGVCIVTVLVTDQLSQLRQGA